MEEDRGEEEKKNKTSRDGILDGVIAPQTMH